MNRFHARTDSFTRRPHGKSSAPHSVAGCPWLVAVMALAVNLSPAQEALRNSMAGAAAAEARRLRPESLPFTFKTGELRLLATPSLGVDFNDNINTANTSPQSDFILKPMVQFNVNYPVTQHNLLNLDIGLGYDKYFSHDELSTWRAQSGSELSFDIYVKDFWINLHDRFAYAQDAAREAAVAGSAEFGNINNTAGLLVTWDLEDLTLSLGYDHQNVISPAAQFQSQDRATELVVGRAGFRLHPRITAGVEGTGSFTAYDQMVLNDNSSYSAGVYADWQPGSYFRIQPRAGYTIYQFQNTSAAIQTADLNSWYADLTVTHAPTESVNYSVSAGHEVRLGIQSDAIDDWYLRPNINWSIIKDVNLTTSLFYEHGEQGAGNVAGNLTEIYDWFGGSLGASYQFMKKARIGLNYRLTLRSSSTPSREYTQNLVQLQFTYLLQ